MPTVPLNQTLDEATSLLDLAARLGCVVLDNAEELRSILGDPDARTILGKVEAAAADGELRQVWIDAGEDGSFAGLAALDLVRATAKDALAVPALPHLGVLRGLCSGAIKRYFDATEDVVLVERGTPLPFVDRPVHLLMPTTTHHTTSTRGHLLEGLGHRIFEHSPEQTTPVVLDFSKRDQIDEITWRNNETANGRPCLPRVATIHRCLGKDDLEVLTITPDWFFDARPRAFDREEVLTALREVGDIPIALLPELSVPAADVLATALEADPDAFPDIVVAGSAHARDGAVRTNEVNLYLKGEQVLRHRKIHPYATKSIGDSTFSRALPEGLTTERKQINVLAGRHTRLAVLICADLNDDILPDLLHHAGVNFLLVPTLTPSEGSFNGAVCRLSSYTQAITVVANGVLDSHATGERPFLVLVGTPRPTPDEQSYTAQTQTDGPVTGVLDLNRPRATAVTWR